MNTNRINPALLLMAVLFCIEMTVDAQWLPTGTTTGNIYYNNGNVGIGTNSIVSKLTLLLGEGSLLSAQTSYTWNNKIFEVTQESSDGFLYLRNALGTTVTKLSGYSTVPSFFNSNVGIGTTSPSNRQGWERVLDVNSPDNSKILSSANGDTYRTGMYAHQSWFGGGGFIGTESNHNLFFITNYDPKMAILTNGNVLIGKTTQANANYKFDVAGKIRADEIVVNTTGADFVFEPSYKLRSLSELETFIHTNKHLPDIAPAKEMQENGVNAGEMQTKLLQKVEELTLYVIELKKENEKLRSEKDEQVKELKHKIENLELKLN